MSLTTGDVADEAGVDYQTVLCYEREGLIDEPPQLYNGYRQSPHEAVCTIQFMQRVRDLGFTLKEIDRLLDSLRRPRRAAVLRQCPDLRIFKSVEKQ